METPPQSGRRVPDDTPPNKGTACIGECQVDPTIASIVEYITEDLEKTEECEVEIMLQAMLRIIAQKTDDSVENQDDNKYTEDLRSGIKTYCDSADEGERYPGTALALNAIVSHFRSDSNQEALPAELRVPKEELATIFKINDPNPIKPHPLRVPNTRKPDIIQLNWQTARKLDGCSNEFDRFEDTVILANRRPKKKKDEELRWSDVLMTFELKKKKSIKISIPEKYESVQLTRENTKDRLKPPRSGFEADPFNASTSVSSTSTKLRKKPAAQPGASTSVRETRSSSSIGKPSSTPMSSSPTTASASASIGDQSDIPELSPQTHAIKSKKRGIDRVVSESLPRKVRKPSASLHPAVQSAIYAAERLSTGAWIKSAIGVVLIDENLYLSMYDRQSPLAARGFDFITYLPHFVVLILILQRLPSCHWDTIAFAPTPEDAFTLEERRQLTTIEIDGQGYQFKMSKSSTPYVLTGHGTTSVPATKVNGPLPLFLKMSWPETVRQRESTIIEKIKEVGEQCEVVKDHTPNLVAFDTLTVHSTSHIRALRLRPTDRDCSRVLCCAIFEMLQPITELKGMEFWRAYWDIIAVHHILWQRGIQHCDISTSNLMYRRRQDGTSRGVLNDYDLSRLRTDGKREGSSGNDRTGTIPFMALDLLSQTEEAHHLYRHDLESFAWVLFWVVLSRDKEQGSSHPPQPFANWSFSASEVCREKSYFLNHFKFQVQDPVDTMVAILIQFFWSLFYTRRQQQDQQGRLRALGLETVDADNQGVQQGEEKDIGLLKELIDFLASHLRGVELAADFLQCLPVGPPNSNDLLPSYLRDTIPSPELEPGRCRVS